MIIQQLQEGKKLVKISILQIGDTKIKKVKFKYLPTILTVGRTCDTEVRRRIEKCKDAFRNLNTVLRNTKSSLETKNIVLNSYVVYALL